MPSHPSRWHRDATEERLALFWTGRVNLVAVCGRHLPFLPITGAFSSCLHWIRPCDGSFLLGLPRGLISKEVPLGSSSKPLELPLQPSRGMLLPRRWHSAVTRPSSSFVPICLLNCFPFHLQSHCYNLACEELFCDSVILCYRSLLSSLSSGRPHFDTDWKRESGQRGQRMWIISASPVYCGPRFSLL